MKQFCVVVFFVCFFKNIEINNLCISSFSGVK